MFKYGVFSGPYFPIFGLNPGKYGPEKTSYLDIFWALHCGENVLFFCWKKSKDFGYLVENGFISKTLSKPEIKGRIIIHPILLNANNKGNDFLTLSWSRSLSYGNQTIDLLCRSMDCILYDRDLRYERVKYFFG